MPKFTDCPSQPADAPSIGRVTNRHIADSRPPSEDAGVDMPTYGNAHLWHTYAHLRQCTPVLCRYTHFCATLVSICPLMAMHASLVRRQYKCITSSAGETSLHFIASEARQEPQRIIIAVNAKRYNYNMTSRYLYFFFKMFRARLIDATLTLITMSSEGIQCCYYRRQGSPPEPAADHPSYLVSMPCLCL